MKKRNRQIKTFSAIRPILCPLFSVYTKLGMVDKFRGLVLLYLPPVMPFAVMVLLNYLHSVPFTLEEAAVSGVCGGIYQSGAGADYLHHFQKAVYQLDD